MMRKQKSSKQERKKKLDWSSIKRNSVHKTNHTMKRQAFSKVRRPLSEEELSSPAVQRLLLDELDRLEQLVSELSEYQNSFHELEKELAMLRERTRKSTALEILSGVCLTFGACLIGLTPYLWRSRLQGYLSLVIGGSLIICGIISRALRK